MDRKEKKAWMTPKLTEHGDVARITLTTVKLKAFGAGDDFCQNVSSLRDGITSC